MRFRCLLTSHHKSYCLSENRFLLGFYLLCCVKTKLVKVSNSIFDSIFHTFAVILVVPPVGALTHEETLMLCFLPFNPTSKRKRRNGDNGHRLKTEIMAIDCLDNG